MWDMYWKAQNGMKPDWGTRSCIAHSSTSYSDIDYLGRYLFRLVVARKKSCRGVRHTVSLTFEIVSTRFMSMRLS